MERIRVLVVEPYAHPKLVEIDHTLAELQKLVGGSIAATYPYDDPVVVISADDAMALGYPPNRLLCDEDGNPYDILKGTFFICGLSSDDFASISDELAEKFTKKFYWPEVFARIGDHVFWCSEEPGARPKVLS